jgi:hypothetical protein
VCTSRLAGHDTGVVSRGHDEIRVLLKPRADHWREHGIQRRHVQSSIWIDDLGPDRAHAHSYMVLMSTSPGEPTIAVAASRYEFDLVKREALVDHRVDHWPGRGVSGLSGCYSDRTAARRSRCSGVVKALATRARTGRAPLAMYGQIRSRRC